jgi:HD superfamily phosphohydrolase
MAMKFEHEFRDPIHAFVRMDSYERHVVDSAPFQRLRHIHQLALTYLVYPGATHRRFEHCLGVMELAGRVFDTIIRPDKLREAHDLVEPLTEPRTTGYWRNVVRMAALCHDLGHLPFSHAGEGLLPDGESHESITRRFIESEELTSLMLAADPPIRAGDVADLATKTPGLEPWKQILAEIIQSDFFGVDRIDYLLRDSHHAGVGYGRFDHFRLLDTLRILPSPPADISEGVEAWPALGVERGGMQSAEQLLLARHYMFSGLYLHPIRSIYDVHLADFLREWLPGGAFPIEPDELLRMHDQRVLLAIEEAAADADAPGHGPARRIVKREHFRPLYVPNRADYRENLDAGAVIAQAVSEQFGAGSVRHSTYPPKGAALDFPVLIRGRVVPASSQIDVLTEVPPTRFDAVFIAPERLEEAERWLEDNKDRQLKERRIEEEDEE